jgi:thiol:disulfide interchange protein DsbD
MNYGYVAEVTFPIPVKFTRPVTPDAPVRLEAHVKYLICEDICVPGEARVAITLPLPPREQPLVENWAARLRWVKGSVPRPAPATWRASAALNEDEFALTVRLDRDESAATFFPLDPNQINDAAPPIVTTNGSTVTLRLKKSDALAKPPARLRGVLVLGRLAYIIEAPVASARPRGVQGRPPGDR